MKHLRGCCPAVVFIKLRQSHQPELNERATALPGRTTPPTPALPELPVQAWGVRPSRALPYELNAHAKDGWEFVALHPQLPIVNLIFKRDKAAI